MPTGQTVTVACKIPNGLYLRVFEFVDHDEPVLGGGIRTVKTAVPKGEKVLINGPAVPFGVHPKHRIEEGYALTYNVDKELWDLWFEQNKDTDIVKNKLIWASEKPDNMRGFARENAARLSGMEPVTPGNDYRVPKSPRFLSKIEKADNK